MSTLLEQADSCLQFAHCVGLQAAYKGSNFVFSPLSIRAALSLAAAGSKSETLRQFLSFLGSFSVEHLNAAARQLLASVHDSSHPEDDDGRDTRSILSFASGVWVDQSLTLKPSFVEIAACTYDAVAKPVDFKSKHLEAVGEVNAWVQSKTGELIKDLIPTDAVDSSTRVILANALYFKGRWVDEFDRSKTVDGHFYLLDGGKIQTPFMTSFKNPYMSDRYIASYDGFKVLKLPYHKDRAGRKLSMMFFLPNQRDGLGALVQKAVSDSSFFNRHVPTRAVETGKFMIPKFKISSGFDASKVLMDLGLKAPFTRNADFTEMVPSSQIVDNLFISNVYHRSTIEVGEEGTEAAAATSVVIKLCCYVPPVDFIADHPFMFAIREDCTGALLFIGFVVNPTI